MSARIKVLKGDFKSLGSTSKAFNVEKTKELMREYLLSFSVVNKDSVFDYLSEDSVFLYNGQYFDVAGIDGDSGSDNVTQITAEHISYRLANYTVPNNYSFVGTAKQIAEDILAEAKTVDGIPANKVFSVGECTDIGTVTFALSGTNVTARAALIGMSKLGVEIDFDNFTVNIHSQVGAKNGIAFEYGKNLNGVHRTWQKGNGWSYDVKIVDLQKMPGNGDKAISLGDTVTVYDTLGKFTLEKRIISYTECDDPSQNRVTIGVFVRDSVSFSIETEHLAMNANVLADTANGAAKAAQKTADNSVQQGTRYNNVAITHADGFQAVTIDETRRVLMNSNDGFVVQVKKNDKWVTVNSLEEWGLLVERLTRSEDKGVFYITIGSQTDSDGIKKYGLRLMLNEKESGHLYGCSGYFIIEHDNDIRLESPNVSISGSKVAGINGKTRAYVSSSGTTGISGNSATVEAIGENVKIISPKAIELTAPKLFFNGVAGLTTNIEINNKLYTFDNGILRSVYDPN